MNYDPFDEVTRGFLYLIVLIIVKFNFGQVNFFFTKLRGLNNKLHENDSIKMERPFL